MGAKWNLVDVILCQMVFATDELCSFEMCLHSDMGRVVVVRECELTSSRCGGW